MKPKSSILGPISPSGLYGGYEKIKKAIELLEKNNYYKVNILCEPQLGKRGLYPTISSKTSGAIVKSMMDFIAYADGNNDLIEQISQGNIDFDLLIATPDMMPKLFLNVAVMDMSAGPERVRPCQSEGMPSGPFRTLGA